MSTLLMDASLARQAMRHFGLDAQLQILQEELAEAIVAISHLRRGRCGSREDLVDAIGDVLVMIDQLRTEPSAPGSAVASSAALPPDRSWSSAWPAPWGNVWP